MPAGLLRRLKTYAALKGISLSKAHCDALDAGLCVLVRQSEEQMVEGESDGRA